MKAKRTVDLRFSVVTPSLNMDKPSTVLSDIVEGEAV